MKKYQAIVIGGGMSGSWVAKELCDRGIQTLLLERGPEVNHLEHYPTASKHPLQFEHRGRISDEEKEENPIVSKCYNYYEGSKHFFVKDKEHPYVQKKPFSWIRGYQIGGKSLLWARQVQRWSKFDFNGPKQDNFAIPWPISYNDIAPWYDKVEEFIGVSGEYDKLETLPDGKFLKSIGLSVIDKHIQKVAKENYKDMHVIYGRCAHLTEVKEIHRKQGRGQCQNRLLCERGCPFGGYFSANSSTIPWAKKTGNLTIRAHSVVQKINYNKENGLAKSVDIIDAQTGEKITFESQCFFLNAGTLNTNLILLNSRSDIFPSGLGSSSKLLGKYIAFHNYRARLNAETNDFNEFAIDGKSITNAYIPRFQNVKRKDRKYKRGFAVALFNYRPYQIDPSKLGDDLVEEYLKKGNLDNWKVTAMMMGETIPKLSNQVYLHDQLKDPFGIPQLVTDVDYDSNDELMMEDFYNEMEELFKKSGFNNLTRIDTKQAPGHDIHHMGGARMGADPKDSVVNPNNQLHDCLNVYVSDGACMTSTGTQNPSLTFMALAARAANHAADTFFNKE